MNILITKLSMALGVDESPNDQLFLPSRLRL
jgi:hypothetical protein